MMWQYQSPGGTYQTFRTKEEAEDAMKTSVELMGGNRYSIVVNQKEGGLEHLRDIRESELADYVGKEMAEKIVNDADGTTKTYSGLDLEVGGEFHKQLYDKKITNFAKKFLKKYGVEPQRFKPEGAWEVFDPRTGKATNYFSTEEEASDWVADWNAANQGGSRDYSESKNDYWYIDITPEMREEIMTKGVPLTQRRQPIGLMPAYA
jgi:hypothetical protein